MEKKVVKSGIWYTISNFILKSVSFLTAPLFVRLMSKAQFGDFNNYLSWMNIITIICTLNLHSTLSRARYDFEEDFKSYVLSLAALGGFVTLVGYGFVCIFMNQFTVFFSLKSVHIHLMFLTLLFSPSINLYQVVQRLRYQYKMSVAISALVTLAGVGASVLLILLMKDRLLGRIIGSQLPVIIIGAVILLYFMVQGKKVHVRYWKYALLICLPYLPHLLSLNILNSMDRVMITKICGSEDNAMYSLAYSCGLIAMYFMDAFNSAYAPWIGEKIHLNSYDEIKAATRKYILVYAVPVVGLMLLAPEVLYVMGGQTYMDAKYVLIPIILGCVCQMLYTLYVNVEQFQKKTIGMAAASVTAALLNLGLNAWLIPKFGYIAAAYTTLISYLYLLFIHYLLVRRMKMHIVYDTTFMVGYLVVIHIFGLLINLLYQLNVVRYGILAVYMGVLLIVCVKYRKTITSYIR